MGGGASKKQKPNPGGHINPEVIAQCLTADIPAESQEDVVATPFAPLPPVSENTQRNFASLLRNEGSRLVSWVAVCCSSPELHLAMRIAEELEDSGLFVKGADSPPSASNERLATIAGAGVLLLILGPALEKDKKAKVECQHAVKTATPIVAVLSGPVGYRPNAKWLRSYISSDENQHHDDGQLNFQNENDFDSNMAMLVLLLKPTNFSDVAREMSTVAPDKLPDTSRLVHQLTNPHDERKCRRALRQLVGAALTDNGPNEILDADGVTLIANAVTSHAGNDDVVLFGCWTLMHLLATSREACTALHNAVSASFFLDIIESHQTDLEVTRLCLLALLHMSRNGHHIPVRRYNVVIEAIGRHLHDAEVTLHGIRLIHTIALSTSPGTIAQDLATPKMMEHLEHVSSSFSASSMTGNAAVQCKEKLISP